MPFCRPRRHAHWVAEGAESAGIPGLTVHCALPGLQDPSEGEKQVADYAASVYVAATRGVVATPTAAHGLSPPRISMPS